MWRSGAVLASLILIATSSFAQNASTPTGWRELTFGSDLPAVQKVLTAMAGGVDPPLKESQHSPVSGQPLAPGQKYYLTGPLGDVKMAALGFFHDALYDVVVQLEVPAEKGGDALLAEAKQLYGEPKAKDIRTDGSFRCVWEIGDVQVLETFQPPRGKPGPWTLALRVYLMRTEQDAAEALVVAQTEAANSANTVASTPDELEPTFSRGAISWYPALVEAYESNEVESTCKRQFGDDAEIVAMGESFVSFVCRVPTTLSNADAAKMDTELSAAT